MTLLNYSPILCHDFLHDTRFLLSSEQSHTVPTPGKTDAFNSFFLSLLLLFRASFGFDVKLMSTEME